MFRSKSAAATAPQLRPAIPGRHRPRRRYPLVRRDPRRFARGMARIHASPSEAASGNSDLRFFAHSFAATFLFVTLLIA